MPSTKRRLARLRALSDAFRRDRAALTRALALDPVGEVRRFEDPNDREIAAFLAAAIALGRASAIRAKQREVWDRLGGEPSRPPRRGALDGFVHRFWKGEEIAAFHRALLSAREKAPLGARFARHYDDGRSDGLAPRSALVRATTFFLDEVLPRSVRAARPGRIPLLPSPADGSAAKRTFLLLRWMIRDDDGVDLGLWRDVSLRGVPPAALVLPLDTHVFRILRLTGFIRRKTPSLAAALEATEALAEADPRDPLRFDFPLAHHGILGRCAGRYVEALCEACPLRSICAATR